MASNTIITSNDSLMRGNAELFRSGRFSDMTVDCGSRSWKLHKTIVLVQSDVFESVCEGGFMDTGESRVVLHDDDESAVAAMLFYFYHSTYDAERANTLRYALLLFHVKVFHVAEKYCNTALSKLAIEKFNDAVQTAWHTDGFADAVREIYATTTCKDNDLRRAAVAVAKAHASVLFAECQGETKFKRVASETPAFTAELVQAMASCPPTSPPIVEAPTVHDQHVADLPADHGHPARPILSGWTPPASLDEPEKRVYRCPSCKVAFTAQI
ncbi:hypothetical protein LTR85_010476 [Meristemomyces frigidus]|nr:hypothetical protein LTR85_010476 [Meristemomyces frigidus]